MYDCCCIFATSIPQGVVDLNKISTIVDVPEFPGEAGAVAPAFFIPIRGFSLFRVHR